MKSFINETSLGLISIIVTIVVSLPTLWRPTNLRKKIAENITIYNELLSREKKEDAALLHREISNGLEKICGQRFITPYFISMCAWGAILLIICIYFWILTISDNGSISLEGLLSSFDPEPTETAAEITPAFPPTFSNAILLSVITLSYLALVIPRYIMKRRNTARENEKYIKEWTRTYSERNECDNTPPNEANPTDGNVIPATENSPVSHKGRTSPEEE